MNSKIKIWDLFSTIEKNWNKSVPLCFICSEFTFEEMFLTSDLIRNLNLKNIWADHIQSKDWVSENLQELTLLGISDHFFIRSIAKNTKKDVVEALNERIQEGYFGVYVFKSKTLLKVKSDQVQIFEVDKLNQWEIPRFLDFLDSFFSIDSKKYREQYLNWPVERLYFLYENVKKISTGDVPLDNCFEKNNFSLLDNFFKKDLKQLYQHLLELAKSGSHGQLFQLLSMLRNTLLKMGDGVYLKNCPQNKFNNKILNAAKLYSAKEIGALVKSFSHLEINLKKGVDDFLIVTRRLILET